MGRDRSRRAARVGGRRRVPATTAAADSRQAVVAAAAEAAGAAAVAVAVALALALALALAEQNWGCNLPLKWFDGLGLFLFWNAGPPDRPRFHRYDIL